MTVARLILASGSPRRRELLAHLGVAFEVHPPDIDESVHADERADRYVERLAREKASLVAAVSPGVVVLAADTTVALDGEIFAKPVDDADAARMLHRLSGRAHQVHTGVAVVARGELRSIVVTTEVVFDVLTPLDVTAYVAGGEPLDKAGAYAIQGAGAAYVREVRGSVTNVVGLPLVETRHLLAAAGVLALPPG